MTRIKHVRIGKRMLKTLLFIQRVNGWHTFDNTTRPEILRLEAKNLVKVEGCQFRITEYGKIKVAQMGYGYAEAQ